MSREELIRWGAIALMAGGVVWVIAGILEGFAGDPPTFGPLAYTVAVLLTAVGVLGIHALQKENYGRIGRGGLYTFLIAAACQILGMVVFILGSAALGFLVFPLGTLGIIVGLALYGAATLQAKVLPRWYAIALIIVVPVSILFGDYSSIWNGVVFGALGYVLWSIRETTGESPARVR
jgi:hypothetical protein